MASASSAGRTRSDRSPTGDDGFPARHRYLVIAGLTMVSGCSDALSYLGLGHVFPANMTGNTVLLGIGLATGDMGAASRSATALGAFLFAAAVVGATVPARVGRRALVAALAGEAALLAALCGWWLSTGLAHPVGATRYGLVALAGATMGAQSGLVRALGVRVATTYITGTWTALSSGVAARLRRGPSAEPSAGRSHTLNALVVATYLATAFGAALAYTRLGAIAAALPLGIVLLVQVAVRVGSGRAARR
jgi:uncharacterized membrane protein YoaK (UPF0700 family)